MNVCVFVHACAPMHGHVEGWGGEEAQASRVADWVEVCLCMSFSFPFLFLYRNELRSNSGGMPS